MRPALYGSAMPQFGEPGQRIGYEVLPHPESAPPLLLFHGFSASPAAFMLNLPALTKKFKVVTVDLLGHGESDAPKRSRRTSRSRPSSA